MPHCPWLHEALCRYLYATSPLVSPEQHARTREVVEDFRTGLGKELQAALVAHDKAHPDTSYISSASWRSEPAPRSAQAAHSDYPALPHRDVV